MKAILAMTALALAGCGAAPAVRTEVQTVYVDRPVLCKVKDVPVPAWPTASIKPGDSLFKKMQAALAEIEVRKAYESKLLAANKACQ